MGRVRLRGNRDRGRATDVIQAVRCGPHQCLIIAVVGSLQGLDFIINYDIKYRMGGAEE